MAHANPAGSATEPVQKEGLQAPKLVQQAVLSYPPEAVDAHGDVSVLIEVDAQGNTLSVRFESGPEVFRGVSLQAANELVFSPATRNGEAVPATTRVWFHFAPPETPSDEPVAELIVHYKDPDKEDTHARTTLHAEQLEQTAGGDLAETVSQVAGVRMAKGTADSSKPIIRGQPERRLLVLFDGVRHESQKWGPDHATEIDPFAAGSISVVRGAAGARYGPDAVGGVILVDPPPMRTTAGVSGTALTAYSTNGRRPYGAVRLDAATDGGMSLRIEGNAAQGASLTAPNYILGNTASKSWNLGGAVAYRWHAGQVRASWHHHDLSAGVFYGVNNSTPDDFQAQVDADRPVTADLWQVTYSIDRPYQSVSHDIGILSTDVYGDWGRVEATYAFQINLRQEFERARNNIVGPQFDFTLRTHSLDVVYEHPSASPAVGDLEGGLGVQGVFQENVYRGLSLIPNFRAFSGGVFGYERLSVGRIDVEAGARADMMSQDSYLVDYDYEAHVRRGTINEGKCQPLENSIRCPAAYDASTFALGALFHAIPEHLDLKVDVSTATRFPDVDELYMLGSAPSFPVYATGYPDLGVETVWASSFTAGLIVEVLEAEASAYGQLVDDYIYFAPELNNQGNPRFDVTIRGTWPSWSYQPIDAAFYGADGTVSVLPHAVLGMEALASTVRATDRDSGEQLIGTPSDQVTVSLIGRPAPIGPSHDIAVRATLELVAQQSRVEAAQDFAPPPDGYALFGAGISAKLGTKRPVRTGVEVRNLMNTSYREYNSLLRYYADQPGRDVRFRAAFDF